MEPETKLTKEEIVEKLRNGIVTVLFIKTNGEEREMKATLLEEYLPKIEVKKEDIKEDIETIKKNNADIVICWDMDKQSWRSFRVDSVITLS